MNDMIMADRNLPSALEDLAQFALIGREKLVAVRAEIRAIEKVGLAKEVREQKLREAQEIAEVVLDAEVKIGQILRSTPQAQHGGVKNESVDTAVHRLEQNTKQALKDCNHISTKQAQRFEALAAANDAGIIEQAKAEAKANDDIVSRSLVLGMVKQEKAEQEKRARAEDIARQEADIKAGIIKPTGLFDVIAIDPPWQYGTRFDPAGRRVANPYPEMSQGELLELEVPAKDDSVVFLWTTQRFLWDAKELLERWGFDYRATLVWDKELIGMGDLLRMQCEFCLIGIKGHPIFKPVHNLRDIIREPRREHSRKPEAFYNMVDSLCTGLKLDYFARERRSGWSSFGNDADKFSDNAG